MDIEKVKINPKKIDFNKLVNEIYNSDRKWSDRKIASKVGVSFASIENMRKKKGVDPKYSTGTAIIELHKKVIKK